MNDSLRLGGSSDHGSLPILTYLCPHVAQVHGSRLRLLRVSSADSGEYVCRVENGSGSKEASITVSVPHHTHSGPSLTSGEQSGRAGQGTPRGSPHYSQEIVPVISLGTSGQEGHSAGFDPPLFAWGDKGADIGAKVGLVYLGPHDEVLFSDFIRK